MIVNLLDMSLATFVAYKPKKSKGCPFSVKGNCIPEVHKIFKGGCILEFLDKHAQFFSSQLTRYFEHVRKRRLDQSK